MSFASTSTTAPSSSESRAATEFVKSARLCAWMSRSRSFASAGSSPGVSFALSRSSRSKRTSDNSRCRAAFASESSLNWAEVADERRTAAGTRQPARQDEVVFLHRGGEDLAGGVALLGRQLEAAGDAEFV